MHRRKGGEKRHLEGKRVQADTDTLSLHQIEDYHWVLDTEYPGERELGGGKEAPYPEARYL